MFNKLDSIVGKIRFKYILQLIFGWLLLIPAGFITLVCFSLEFDAITIVMTIFFALITVAGIVLVVKANKLKKLIRTYNFYISVVGSNDTTISIDSLAQAAGNTVDSTVQNVKNLLSLGCFPGYSFDAQKNLLFSQKQQPESNITEQYSNVTPITKYPSPNKQVAYVSIKCPGCGALNSIAANSVGTCEYCGSTLTT